VAAWLVAAAAPAAAQDAPRRLSFEVTVALVSQEPGPVDPRGRQADQLLRRKLRYESLRVLDSGRRSVALDQVETVRLPTGQRFRFRPLDLGSGGVLVAVDAEGMAQGDFRIARGKPLVLGGGTYQDGQLFVILEPHF
jgi:hypothetical protein